MNAALPPAVKFQPAVQRLSRHLAIGISAYLLFNAIVLALVSGTADQDQAEQLLLAQVWASGYGPQPPLYTYLVKAVFLVTGPALLPLLLLKAALLSLLVLAVLRIGLRLGFRADQQLLAVGGLALLPQFVWESQRDLSHSVLATTVAAWTLLQLLRLAARPTPANHGLLGLLVAAGLLSKYNVAVFLAGLLLTALGIPTLRRALLRPALAVGVAAALVALAPHLSWALAHSTLALAGLEKAQTLQQPAWRGVLSALGAAVAFLSPYWIVALALLWPERRHLHLAAAAREPGATLLQRLPLAVMAVMLVFVLASGAGRIKDRWYQSLLFHMPVGVATLAPPLPRRRRRWLVGAGVGAAAATTVLLPARTLLAGSSGKTSRPNMPLPALVRQLEQRHGRPDLILASGSLLAGNARVVLPDVTVLTPRALIPGAPLPAQPAGAGSRVLVLIDRDAEPADLQPLVERVLGRSLDAEQLRRLSLPLHWAARESYAIHYAWMAAGGG
jgi:4-amino-4-deoxy-L-arabinose transferase-like glycosyltransferase